MQWGSTSAQEANALAASASELNPPYFGSGEWLKGPVHSLLLQAHAPPTKPINLSQPSQTGKQVNAASEETCIRLPIFMNLVFPSLFMLNNQLRFARY